MSQVRFLFFSSSFLLSGIIHSQFIEGRVIDSETRDPIPYVNIWYKETVVGTFSDESGKFRLPVSDNKIVSFSSVGYHRFDYQLEMTDENLLILLTPKPIQLDDIIVKSDTKWKDEEMGYRRGIKFPFLGITFWEYQKQFWKIHIPNNQNNTGFLKRINLGIVDKQPETGIIVIEVFLTDGKAKERPLMNSALTFKIDLDEVDDQIVFDVESKNIPITNDMNVYLTFIGVEGESSFGGGLLDLKRSGARFNESRLFHRQSVDQEWYSHSNDGNKHRTLNLWFDVDVKSDN